MHRPVITLFALVAVLAACTAHAATVQKCRRVDGAIAYQSAACGPGERTLGTWEATPDTVERPVRALRTPREPRIARRGPRSAPVRNEIASVNACAAAKARRDEVERRVGLARTCELLSRLRREVFDACR